MFTRGLDPKVAMGIGITTWENLNERSVLYVKKPLKLWQDNNGEYLFARDGRRSEWGLGTKYIGITEIKRTLIKNVVNIKIKFAEYRSIQDLNNTKGFRLIYVLQGPLEQFKKYFDIVQHTKL